MYTIENDKLRVIVNPIGAELSGLFNKTNNREYLWSGDPAFWSKRSPVLFPIVGTLKDHRYIYNNKSYELGRHGFGRDKVFAVTARTALSLTFEIQEDNETLSVFPFQFSLAITYTIAGNRLYTGYQVKNKGTGEMYFSVGGHPAFKLPLSDKVQYDDYYLLFNKKENAGRWLISPGGLIEKVPEPLLDNSDRLWLSKSLFYRDAVVLKNLHSDEVQLMSDKHPAGLSVNFQGFPYLGIWAAKDADFVCIEPWCGIADSVDSNQLLTDKEGVIHLLPGEDFERKWSVITW